MTAEAERTVVAAPGSALAHILRGRMRALQGDVPGCEADMEMATSLDPLRPEPWQRMGLLALGRGQYGKSVQHLARAAALVRPTSELRVYLAAAHLGLGDEAAAHRALAPLVATGKSLDDLLARATGIAAARPR
jgi:uncharacterized protein HemY